jgi:hypothetical protein
MKTFPDRRESARREDDKIKPMYMSGTIVCAWIGMAASVTALTFMAGGCETRDYLFVVTLFSSFGGFVFRLFERRRIQ